MEFINIDGLLSVSTLKKIIQKAEAWTNFEKLLLET